jgi:hypothetical protein
LKIYHVVSGLCPSICGKALPFRSILQHGIRGSAAASEAEPQKDWERRTEKREIFSGKNRLEKENCEPLVWDIQSPAISLKMILEGNSDCRSEQRTHLE